MLGGRSARCTPCLRGSHVLCPSPSCFSRTQTPCDTYIYSVCWIVWAVGRGHREVYAAFGGFSISQLSISHTVVASGREASEKKRAEARRGQGRCWGEASEGARELLPWTASPARRSTLIPSTPLRGNPRAAALRLFYIPLVNTVCVVACLRTTYLAPIPQPLCGCSCPCARHEMLFGLRGEKEQSLSARCTEPARCTIS
jgi:hypothetical protein